MIDFPKIHDEAFGYDEVYFHQEDVTVEIPDMEQVIMVLKSMAEQESAPLRELNYILCSDDYLLEMNRQHLDHDYYTDVITFPHLQGNICGDVYVSTDRVAENARKSNINFETELLRVMLHGALHLAGYQDGNDEQKVQMRTKEDAYLALFEH